MKCKNCLGDTHPSGHCPECGAMRLRVPWEMLVAALLLLAFTIIHHLT